MAKIIFINGYPASGKSTLIKILRERNIKCPVICKDEIKEILFTNLELNNKENGQELNNTVLAILFSQVADHVRSSTNLLVEGNFKPIYDQSIVDGIFSGIKYKTLQVMLVADKDILLQRDKQRLKLGYRHEGHGKLNEDRIISQLTQVKHFNIDGSKLITVDTSTFTFKDYNNLADKILSYLRS